MSAATSTARAALLDHPLMRDGRLWQAGSLGHCQSRTLSSGFAALDAELPGGGWPSQSLCEILQPAGQHAEWRLLAPGLRKLFAATPGAPSPASPPLLLIAPPFVPHGPGLLDLGLEAAHWVSIQPASGAVQWGRPPEPASRRPPCQGHPHPRHADPALHQALWVTEQAIKSQAAGAILAWLDGARPEQIRRLQAAALNSPAPVFLMRPDQAATQSSAAPLRLRLSQPASARGLAPGLLDVLLIKRRGPAMVQPLTLHSLPPRLQHCLPARLRQGVAPLQRPADRIATPLAARSGVSAAQDRAPSAPWPAAPASSRPSPLPDATAGHPLSEQVPTVASTVAQGVA